MIDAIKLHEISHLYQVEDGIKIALDYMMSNINTNTENIVPIINCAYTYNHETLKSACIKLVSGMGMTIFDLLKKDLTTPMAINAVYLMPLRIHYSNEKELLKFLEQYVVKYENDISDIREKLKPAISSIRFLAVPNEEISKISCISEKDKEILLAIKNQNLATSFAHLNVTRIMRDGSKF